MNFEHEASEETEWIVSLFEGIFRKEDVKPTKIQSSELTDNQNLIKLRLKSEEKHFFHREGTPTGSPKSQ
jgi:hypothetical protein